MTAWDENRTVRELVLPRLRAAQWPDELIAEQYGITADERRVVGGRIQRRRRLAADLALMHESGHPICVVEAKKTIRSRYDGVEQAKDYGRRLGLPLVYATNGREIVEIDMRAGTQHLVDRYRGYTELCDYFYDRECSGDQGRRFFETPYSRALTTPTGSVKQMRYYQHRAAHAVLQGVAAGQRRLMTVLATGTGKSMLAAQIAHVLWECNWPRGPAVPDPRPRVLYLADRDVLISDPLLKYFTPIFGSDEVHRIRGERATHTRMYFALYQAITSGAIFEQYDPDWFDLVIVDECHRGSAREDAEWRGVLDHFHSAVHLGLTATPRSDIGADNLAYFGDPVYTYSLREGIQDGFLAPFQVVRAALSTDVGGVHIPAGTVDAEGNEVPEGEYGPSSLERTLVLPERTEAAARFVSEWLARTDRMGKTIVFCVDQDHAARFAEAIGNLNPDLVARHPFWAARITSDEGDRGRALLEQFQDSESPEPVVATTSDLLTTGVDVPNVRTIVFLATVRSMARFKQMLGRGTRLDAEHGKEFFTVIDFTAATENFSDPAFDGPAVRVLDGAEIAVREPAVRVEVVPDEAVTDQDQAVHEPPGEFEAQPGGELGDAEAIEAPDEIDRIERQARKHVVSGHEVHLLGSVLYVVETDNGYRLRPIRIGQWVRDRVLDLGYDADSLRRQWANARSRAALIEALADRMPLTLDELAAELGHPEAEPLDLLLHLAYELPIRSRSDRALAFTQRQRAFLDQLAPQARRIVDLIVEKYVAHGPGDLQPDVLQVPPIAAMGSVTELAQRFGGTEQLHAAFEEINAGLYAS